MVFGLNIERSNVRFVLHAVIPRCLADYMHESGRAGRDGNLAHSVIFFHGRDPIAWDRLLTYDHQTNNTLDELEARRNDLRSLGMYCTNKFDCLRKLQAQQFGETFDSAKCGFNGFERCGNYGNYGH